MSAETDVRMEKTIGYLLRAGVLISAAVVLVGGVCYGLGQRHEAVSYRVFQAAPTQYRSVHGVLSAISISNCPALIQLGLLLLIATPVIRVAVSLVAFGLQRDWTYVAITLTVLAILGYSLMG